LLAFPCCSPSLPSLWSFILVSSLSEFLVTPGYEANWEWAETCTVPCPVCVLEWTA
jgi:hypothetical protein